MRIDLVATTHHLTEPVYNSQMTADSWGAAIESWGKYQRAAGAPSTTIGTRTQHLRHLGKHADVPPFDMTAARLLAYCVRQDWATETRRGRRSTFRAFYAWAVAEGLTETNPALGLPRAKAAPPRPRPAPDTAYRHAIMAAGPREMLMLRLAAEMGLRRAEVAGIHSRDLLEDLGGWSLLVHGKGSKDRVVPLPPAIASQLRALPRGWAFPGDDGGHLSPRWVGKLVTQLMPEGWTMHTLRHRFATRAYAVDKDVFTVQELLGHASPATTRLYVQIPNDSLRRTVDAVAS